MQAHMDTALARHPGLAHRPGAGVPPAWGSLGSRLTIPQGGCRRRRRRGENQNQNLADRRPARCHHTHRQLRRCCCRRCQHRRPHCRRHHHPHALLQSLPRAGPTGGCESSMLWSVTSHGTAAWTPPRPLPVGLHTNGGPAQKIRERAVRARQDERAGPTRRCGKTEGRAREPGRWLAAAIGRAGALRAQPGSARHRRGPAEAGGRQGACGRGPRRTRGSRPSWLSQRLHAALARLARWPWATGRARQAALARRHGAPP